MPYYTKPNKMSSLKSIIFIPFMKLSEMPSQKYVKACVAEQLTPQTPNMEIRGSSPTRCIVSLDKEL